MSVGCEWPPSVAGFHKLFLATRIKTAEALHDAKADSLEVPT